MNTRLYYHIKPFVPRTLRMAMRRHRAKRILTRCGDTWPIDHAAGKKPEGWPGWPDGKDFAFVLTHDVEGQTGLDNVRQLAELEMELGCRSSFNFVPEGDYQVSANLRDWLLENGFEVGVHDLHHDGHLYRSRKAFRENAKRINHYLEQWGAVGFRSGFMLHQLDWLHELNILYDASTFDTDPFEPQPDSCGTIFPFTVFMGKNSYVELPYTLPQDSTLFLLLCESGPEIWDTKLDWVAKQGGLALVNVHPDYVDFSGSSSTADKTAFPAAYYRQFLTHTLEQHHNQFWHPLPKDVAEFVCFQSNGK